MIDFSQKGIIRTHWIWKKIWCVWCLSPKYFKTGRQQKNKTLFVFSLLPFYSILRFALVNIRILILINFCWHSNCTELNALRANGYDSFGVLINKSIALIVSFNAFPLQLDANALLHFQWKFHGSAYTINIILI